MRAFAVALTRYLALVGLFSTAGAAAAGAPWNWVAAFAVAAVWFALLSARIRRGDPVESKTDDETPGGRQ